MFHLFKFTRLQVLLISSILFASFTYAQEFKAFVFSMRGDVQFLLPGTEQWQPAQRGMSLPVGTRIVTKETGTAVIRLSDGSAIRVSANSNLTLNTLEKSKDGEKVRVQLDDGAIGTLIEKKNKDKVDFRIETPQGTAAARGTFYGVVVKDGKTFVKVEEGEVGLLKQALDGNKK